jgi:ureidoglycolate hydrolase
VSGPVRRIGPRPLDPAGWAPFGWLPVADTDPGDGEHRLHFEWADPHVNLIGHTLAEVPHTDGALRCEMLYRHDTHTQTIMPLRDPCVIAVAPAATRFDDPSDVETVQAFLLQPLDAIVLHRGTWHWGPFPTATAEVRLFNVQGLRYPEDNAMVDLAGRDMAVDVVVPHASA